MIIQNVNCTKLHTELNNAGINPFPVFELENGDGDFTFPKGTNMGIVQQIIDAHDPKTPLPQPLSEIDKLKISQAEQFETLLMLIGGM